MKNIHSFDEVHDSQKMFRAILSVLSGPGKTVNITEYSKKMFGKSPSFLAVAMTFLDNETSFNACGNNELEEEIVSLTLARNVSIENADYIFTDNPDELETIIRQVKCGTLADPHKSATIITKIDDSKNSVMILRGPGIKDIHDIHTSGVVSRAIAMRDRQNYEYPCGIDFIFIGDNGDMLGVPRLVSKEDY